MPDGMLADVVSGCLDRPDPSQEAAGPLGWVARVWAGTTGERRREGRSPCV